MGKRYVTDPERHRGLDFADKIAREWKTWEIRRYLRTAPNNYPRFLYKYISPDMPEAHLRTILIDAEFHLSNPRTFNDPFDTSAKMVYVEDPKLEKKHYKQIVNDRMQGRPRHERRKAAQYMANNPRRFDAVKLAFETNIQRTGVSCFTEDPRNILMWSHYAKHHRGAVIQIEFAKDPASLLHAFPMHYSEEYPTYDFHNHFEKQFGKIMLRKSKNWEYEEEWRILRIGGADCFHPFKPQALTGIIFGCRLDPEFQSTILGILADRDTSGMPVVKLYQAKKHSAKYKLQIQKI